ncbi:glycoside hydrolase family 97 protein [Roseimaritima ulvae]|uniref:glycoside hydrolase family 97 protein n=1 Tax=Roseimaritima ulvae TaxID=980254 RepID=UPI00192E37DE|nr:glycoside hydrolase family 97 protein [Roseimaritima ulvae]
MTRVFAIVTLACIGLATAGRLPATEPSEVTSPDGRIALQFVLQEGRPTYQVSVDGQTLLEPSSLGFALAEGSPLDGGFRLLETHTSTSDTTWKPVYGERSEIRDHYREAAYQLVDDRQPPRRLNLRFRVYDEGVAFRYEFPKTNDESSFTISKELTEFRFTGNHRCWAVYTAQGVYAEQTLDAVKSGCERPLVIQTADGPYVAVGEAGLVDFARMKLQGNASEPHSLRADLSGNAKIKTPGATPWRFVMVGDSPGQLLEQNYLLLNLNEPCAIEDTSWIKPGKVIREVTLTTHGGKACIDFAVANGLQYVEFDAGWYGHEYDNASDATTITVDPKRSKGPLDLHEVIRYGEERGIGILLYVNQRALSKQLDEILPLFQQWGIKGVKYGFVHVGSQEATRWLHEAVRKAAEHQLMVDIHDEYRPTGFERTYPNLMTQEGIGGDETSPSNEQTLRIVFTRMVAGAGDNTICYFNKRVERNASHAYQLAKAVCIYSPWQFLYWYDRPAPEGTDPKGMNGLIGDEPELEFYKNVPTVWDETRVIDGQIGQYALIARRSGEQWFVGAMNDDQPRTLSLPLDFLEAGAEYEARIYSDDPSVDTRTHVRIDRRQLDSTQTLDIALPPRGGQAIQITPK